MSMILDILVTIIMTVAAIMQLAVIRDKTVHEDKSVNASRWLLFAGYAMLSARFISQMWIHFEVRLSDFSTLALCLIGAGHIAFCWVRLSRD